ncbi:hypothetical protein [Dongia rigui]|uniref:Uncharacterized protein n=1 Tax=Dongia rigui TaxID=940149 RepID=A0ABU5DZE1_9PROT|nr:hypothetical protein [Dongia rigui]MDY0872650.1 hypothetical protein [Dongia rigui]
MSTLEAVWHQYFQIWRRTLDQAGIDLNQLVTHIELDDGGNATRDYVRADEFVFWKTDEIAAELERNRAFWAKAPGTPGRIIQDRVSGGKGRLMTLQLLASADGSPVAIAAVLTAASLYEPARARRATKGLPPEDCYDSIYDAARYLLGQFYATDVPWSGFIKHALPTERSISWPKTDTLEAAMSAVAAEHATFLTTWKIIRASFPRPPASEGPDETKGSVTSLQEWRNRAGTDASGDTDKA